MLDFTFIRVHSMDQIVRQTNEDDTVIGIVYTASLVVFPSYNAEQNYCFVDKILNDETKCTCIICYKKKNVLYTHYLHTT